MQTLSNELRALLSRRIETARPHEISSIVGTLCAFEEGEPQQEELAFVHPKAHVEGSAASAAIFGKRFVEISVGEVLDKTTGLIWTRDNVGDEELDWADAKKACAKLELGGRSWRLPTVQELLTLVNYERTEPAIDVEAFPSCKSACYWTSTPYASSPSGYAWCVNFDDGGSGWLDQGSEFFVRAVRASQ